jgi:SAM-dependent methyltransferase
MNMRDLNEMAQEYRPHAPTEIENNLIMNWYPRRIIERSGSVQSLLELGLGHGFTAKYFSAASSHHVIVDGASKIIDIFKMEHPDFPGTIVLDYFETFDTSERFDVIVMGFVLEHVDDPKFLLRRYRQFLKPGAKLYIAVPNAKSLNRRLGLEMGLISDIYDLNQNDIALGHQRQYCLDTLRAAVSDSGYTITHQEGIYLKPLPLGVLKTMPDLQANLQAMLQVGIDFPELCVALLVEASATAA